MIKNQIFKFMKIFKFAFSPHPKKMHPEILAHCHHGSSQVGNTPVPAHGPGLDNNALASARHDQSDFLSKNL
jgi:hypothetical protein